MAHDESDSRVLQTRLVVEDEDDDQAVAFYRDVLGAREELARRSGWGRCGSCDHAE